MKYQIQESDNHTVLTLKAERMDNILAPELKGQIIAIQSQAPDKPVVIDLGTVRFADSSGLSALLMAHRLYRDGGQLCVMCNVPERVQELLEISQLAKVFTLADDIDGAVALIGQGAAS